MRVDSQCQVKLHKIALSIWLCLPAIYNYAIFKIDIIISSEVGEVLSLKAF